jgi:hypothetical protein
MLCTAFWRKNLITFVLKPTNKGRFSLNNFKYLAKDGNVSKIKAYICNVKILKGHEAAAPQTAAYFMPSVN